MFAEILSLQIQIIAWSPINFITDTDFGLETNLFCDNFGHNGTEPNGIIIELIFVIFVVELPKRSGTEF